MKTSNLTTDVKFVPRLLQNEQKQHRLEVCRKLKQFQEDANFLSKVITASIQLLSLPQDEN
jgi:hypothetical protein